jgi:type I restriction enzyme M protein
MHSAATDAGSSEKLIRQKLIQTGAVDCIFSVAPNFFYTRSVSCHLWFLDRGKRPENKRKILMIDARNTFRQINTTLRDFSPEQMEGLTAIVKAYRGEDMSKTFANNPWLKEHFPTGYYADVEGLCKIVDVTEVEENDWSLTPGRYVGYGSEIEDSLNYTVRLAEIHEELEELSINSRILTEKILRGAA